MMQFKYTAVTYDGFEQSGMIEAEDKNDAIMKLRANYEIISSIKDAAKQEDFRTTLNFSKKIKDKTLALMCQQFGIILNAGMPITKTIELVSGQMDDEIIKTLLKEVNADVESGMTLADAFQLRGPQLPVSFVETVRAGEESGSLTKSFQRLGEFFEKKSKTGGKVKSALTYPIFVIIVAAVVMGIIMTVAVPMFTKTFEGMGAELPMPTKIVIAISDFFIHWGWVLVLVVIGLVAAYKWYCKQGDNIIAVDKIKLGMPIIGNITRMDCCSQFAATMSTMLSAGLPAIRAIEITGRAMPNRYIGSKIEEVAMDVEQGFTIGGSLRSKGIFPDLLNEMVTVGEETGSLEEVLHTIGDYYDNEVEVVTDRATKLLEPIIICVLAVFVVLIMLAVYAPLFSMYDSASLMS